MRRTPVVRASTRDRGAHLVRDGARLVIDAVIATLETPTP